VESIDDEIESLLKITQCIAAHWGENCEVVLHDLKNKPYDKSIIAIENGHVTGRKVGGMGSNLGLEVLRGTDLNGDKVNYITHTPNGKILRSTSIYFRNSRNEVVGSLCINYDITQLIQAEHTISALTKNVDKQNTDNPPVQEYFSNDVSDLLTTLIQESVKQIGKPISEMTKENKIDALKYLDKRGAFLIKKSMDKVAKYFKISRYTIYNYLEKT